MDDETRAYKSPRAVFARQNTSPTGKLVAQASEQHSSIQLQTFTRWWNAYLEPRSIPVTDLCAQLQDGVLCFRLLEALEVRPTEPENRGKISTFGKKLVAAPRMRLERLANMQSFLAVVKEMGIKLVNIGAEDIEEGNRELILGLTWALVQAFELQGRSNLSLTQLKDSAELLRWVRAQVDDVPGVGVGAGAGAGSDARASTGSRCGGLDGAAGAWTHYFRDGLALCALVHKFRRDALDWEAMRAAPPLQRLRTAFDAAERMGVPPLLDAAALAAGSVDQVPRALRPES
jgi:hypothetical protein